jgi:hypothetical protein
LMFAIYMFNLEVVCISRFLVRDLSKLWLLSYEGFKELSRARFYLNYFYKLVIYV